MKRVLVTGAGGFIGHHLAKRLVADGNWVRGADLKLPEYEASPAQEFLRVDLREAGQCREACAGIDEVYALAADMGGIGYIEGHKAAIVRNNTLIDLNTIEAARAAGAKCFFYASSACVYPGYRQNQADLTPLREEDAYPADAEDGYGWEKLYMERICRHYREDLGLPTRVARFHNIYGPLGAYDGGREKSPAAICRKVALARDGDAIEVWGDGEQTRSYCYIDDCIEGILQLMRSGHDEPLNIGQERLVSVNQLVDLVAAAAGKQIGRRYDRSRPQGVRGRTSDNTRARQVLAWEPEIPLEEGIARTYSWISAELARTGERASQSRAQTAS